MATIDDLAAEKYILLTTYRRDGRAVPTPVWVVRDGDALAAWTPTDSGKAKRIRRSATVTIAPCDVRGRPSGPAVPARASVGDRAALDRVRRELRRKYGLTARLTLLGSRLRRGSSGTVAVRIVPSD
ncbi:PPOX class F420-dependent oxidoreductase [Plantactinospora sp. GCM10030261]|uniref:PPOX class F420-dependent oxidoreductase n=1 Tax=Plantactinospora sp. GCM10030261 TaxID=3273420 RepID=UPI0036138BD4